MNTPQVILRPGREKSIIRKHPWIFSGAILDLKGQPGSGDTVCVCDSKGKSLGYGAFSPKSQIRVRMWSFDPTDEIDGSFFSKKIAAAVHARAGSPLLNVTNSQRLIYSENDGLPGVIADRYGDVIVMQLSSAGAYKWRETIVNEISKQTESNCIYEKSDSDVIQLEGLQAVEGVQFGTLPGEATLIEENGIKFAIELKGSQKTGFYLDQRDNRRLLRDYVRGKKVLDCFCFSGGFTLNALSGGAETVTSVDSSEPVLKLLEKNIAINRMEGERVTLVNENAFDHLRKLRDRGEQFDVIVLDPPKFAPTTAQVERAARAYKDINLLAFKLLAKDGILFTFSCSGGVSLSLFQKIVADSALDAGRNAQIVKFMHQADDHPILTTFPEGEYLKGMVCRVE